MQTPVSDDDIAAVAAFNGHLLVVWSDLVSDRYAARVHVDGDAETDWSAVEDVIVGNANDHINLAVTGDGDVLLASKSGSGHQINLSIRRFATDVWEGPYFVHATGTRPIVVFDEVKEDVFVLYTDTTDSPSSTTGSICYKVAPLSDIADIGLTPSTDIITVAAQDANDVTSTKDAVGGPSTGDALTLRLHRYVQVRMTEMCQPIHLIMISLPDGPPRVTGNGSNTI